jgi:alkylhydroperoxidase family enzyme
MAPNPLVAPRGQLVQSAWAQGCRLSVLYYCFLSGIPAKHKQIVEVTMIAAQYMGTAMLTNALRVKIDEPGVLAGIVLGPC